MPDTSSLDPTFRNYVDGFLAYLQLRLGITPTVTSTRRTRAEQERLYQDYVSGRSKFPAARPGNSAHEYGLAVDLVFRSNSELQRAADLAPSFKLKWGGSKDPVHFAADWWSGSDETTSSSSSSSSCTLGLCTSPECDEWAAWFRAAAPIVASYYGVSHRESEAALREWIAYYYPEVAETCSGYFVVLGESPF